MFLLFSWAYRFMASWNVCISISLRLRPISYTGFEGRYPVSPVMAYSIVSRSVRLCSNSAVSWEKTAWSQRRWSLCMLSGQASSRICHGMPFSDFCINNRFRDSNLSCLRYLNDSQNAQLRASLVAHIVSYRVFFHANLMYQISMKG